MGRSSAEQASRNRARIVAQASRLFRRRGVENVSINDVMTAAGMTVGGFYKHFDSKEALVHEACALSFEQAARSWLTVSARESDQAGSKVAALVRHYFEVRSPDQTCPMLAYAPDMPADGISASTRQVYAHGVQALFELFAEQSSPNAGRAPSSPASWREDAVTFAAMIGARLLVDATKGSRWSKELTAAVVRHVAETHHDAPRSRPRRSARLAGRDRSS